MEFPGLFFFKSLGGIENVRASSRGWGVLLTFYCLFFFLEQHLAPVFPPPRVDVLLSNATQKIGILKWVMASSIASTPKSYTVVRT